MDREKYTGTRTRSHSHIERNMGTRAPIAALLASVLLLTGCATMLERLGGDGVKRDWLSYTEEPVDGFPRHRINGWNPISRTQLVVWTGVNDAYLLTVWSNCVDLQQARRIGVSSTGSRVTRFDKVLVGRDQCPISEIRPIDVRQMKADEKVARDLMRGEGRT